MKQFLRNANVLNAKKNDIFALNRKITCREYRNVGFREWIFLNVVSRDVLWMVTAFPCAECLTTEFWDTDERNNHLVYPAVLLKKHIHHKQTDTMFSIHHTELVIYKKERTFYHQKKRLMYNNVLRSIVWVTVFTQ